MDSFVFEVITSFFEVTIFSSIFPEQKEEVRVYKNWGEKLKKIPQRKNKMPQPTIKEVIQTIFSNDSILDRLEQKRWYVDIDTIHEEELSILQSPNKRLKIMQWDFPKIFMQQIQYDGKLVYFTRVDHKGNVFEEPKIYIDIDNSVDLKHMYIQNCRIR
ncbi:MAG: hypothetical protein Q7K45_00500 [Nanoarchaeota archaeon]|nr:hypothetical protein [Nanoarchaeota archaeon]